MKRVQLVITVGDQRLVLEGDFFSAEIQNDVDLGKATAGMSRTTGRSSHQSDLNLTEEQLIAEKGPRGHGEIVAVLAYSLQQSGVVEFTPEEMKRAYSRARQRPPKVIGQALRDAKNKYDFVEPGKKKGTFRLSPHGERTVMFDLPRRRSNESE